MSFIEELKSQFEKILTHLQHEFSALRTGRATPALVENISVEVYGSVQPIKSLASIAIPDAKTIQIEPWDASIVKSIESALQKSNIGINPNVDGKILRLTMPMMTDEMRQRLVKIVKEKMEEAKIATRKMREDVKKKIERQEGVSDDEKKGDQKKLDEEIKIMNNNIEEVGAKKIEEITTI